MVLSWLFQLAGVGFTLLSVFTLGKQSIWYLTFGILCVVISLLLTGLAIL